MRAGSFHLLRLPGVAGALCLAACLAMSMWGQAQAAECGIPSVEEAGRLVQRQMRGETLPIAMSAVDVFELARADEELRKALPGSLQWGTELTGRGDVWLRLKQFDCALRDYGVVLRSRPDTWRAMLGRARVRAMKNELPLALEDAQAAVRTPNAVPDEARATLGMVLMALGRYDEAVDVLTRIDNPAADPFAYVSAMRAGNLVRAEQVLRDSRAPADSLADRTIRFYRGAIDEAQMRASLPDSSFAPHVSERCEGLFHIALRRLFKGDKAGARAGMQATLDACTDTSIIRPLVLGEMARMSP